MFERSVKWRSSGENQRDLAESCELTDILRSILPGIIRVQRIASVPELEFLQRVLRTTDQRSELDRLWQCG